MNNAYDVRVVLDLAYDWVEQGYDKDNKISVSVSYRNEARER
jgi:hypothetical protein